MRTFRLIGMAILAVCVTFASCSSDDDEELTKNDNGIITNQKRLKQIKYNTDEAPLDLTYDSKGRLTCATYTLGDEGQYITNYVWGNNIIMAEVDYNTDTYILDKNLVRSATGSSDRTFTYDSSNQLIAHQEIDERIAFKSTCTWDNGKITKITIKVNYYYSHEEVVGGDEEVYEFTYSGKTCKGYFPLYSFFIQFDAGYDIFHAHPELIGMHCSQLPDKVYCKSDSSESKYEYSYTFDKDGYVESCTEVRTSKLLSDNTTETKTYIHTFTWE